MPHEHTCQICGREIKTVRGWCEQTREFDAIIAHHGYQRPGNGWQTSSCFGARWRPYEFACDAIPVAITAAEQFLSATKEALLKLRTVPPETLTYDVTYPKTETLTFERPHGFDGAGDAPTSSLAARSYEARFWHMHWELGERIKRTEQDIRRMNKRLADWPHRNRVASNA